MEFTDADALISNFFLKKKVDFLLVLFMEKILDSGAHAFLPHGVSQPWLQARDAPLLLARRLHCSL